MNRTAFLSPVILSALVTTQAWAADVPTEGVHVGVGIAMPVSQWMSLFDSLSSDVSFLSAPEISVPIQVGSLRIEPSLGFLSGSTEDTEAEEKATARVIDFGVGAYYAVRTEQSHIYVGPRLAMSSYSSESTSTADDGIDVSRTQTNLKLSAVVGGEYFLSPSFAIGAEGRLSYTKLGKPTIKVDGEKLDESSSSHSMTNTDGLLFLRFFFN